MHFFLPKETPCHLKKKDEKKIERKQLTRKMLYVEGTLKNQKICLPGVFFFTFSAFYAVK